MKNLHTNILKRLDQIINETADHIHDFIDSPSAFTRKRKLDAFTLIKTTLNMQGNSLEKELDDAFEDEDKLMTASAYVQQKSKLTPECFKHILNAFNQGLPNVQLLDHQYRLFAIDGSDFNQLFNPDSKNIITKQFPQPICQIHVNACYDLLNNTYQDCTFQPKAKMDERSAAIEMLKRLECGPYIVTMDRDYSSFNLIENCNRMSNCYYVIRTRIDTGGGVKEIISLPAQEYDTDISCRVTISSRYYVTHHQYENIHLVMHKKKHYKKVRSKNTKDSRWDFEDFCTVKFRACKFRINDPDSGKEEWEVVLTNLNRKDFPLSRMKELYHMRWGIESSFRKLKYDLGCVQFHSKQDKFIEMEMLAHMIMFNVNSQIDCQAYVPQKHCKYSYIINFKMACSIIHKYYLESSSDQIFFKILNRISRYTVPVRPGRKYTRAIKVQPPIYFMKKCINKLYGKNQVNVSVTV